MVSNAVMWVAPADSIHRQARTGKPHVWAEFEPEDWSDVVFENYMIIKQAQRDHLASGGGGGSRSSVIFMDKHPVCVCVPPAWDHTS